MANRLTKNTVAEVRAERASKGEAEALGPTSFEGRFAATSGSGIFAIIAIIFLRDNTAVKLLMG
jgi:hypothetical protein